MAEKKILNEVCIIRVIVILLLILYHSFAPYCDVWKPVGENVNITPYYWIALVSYSFLLETFVFISGYIFGFQVATSKSQMTGKRLITSKVKRVLFPSLLFSFLYILFFWNGNSPTWNWIPHIFTGVGHLWFLPMLFWCFILTFIIEKTSINYRQALAVTLLLSLLSVLNLPMQLNKSFNYLMFFYAGYVIRRNDLNVRKYCNLRNIIIIGVAYVICTVIGISLKSSIGNGNLIAKVVKFIYSSLGVAFIFLVSYWLVYLKRINISPLFIRLSNICFGVYIFQEFILQFIYYKFTFLSGLDDYYIPWVAFLITLTLSSILTYLCRKTAIGRFVLG